MKITTNNVPREVLAGWELSRDERAEFDYLADPTDDQAWFDVGAQFIRYKGELYDLSEFVLVELQSKRTSPFCYGVEPNSPLLAWDGIRTDSYFSGLLVRYADVDGESIVVGLVTI